MIKKIIIKINKNNNDSNENDINNNFNNNKNSSSSSSFLYSPCVFYLRRTRRVTRIKVVISSKYKNLNKIIKI